MQYDVIIIGAGPGGIFSAYELSKLCPEKKIAVFEEGQPLEKRKCPIDGKTVKHCIGCPTCAIMNGFGGAGAFSDGKYNLTNDFGGTLYEYIGKKQAMELMHYVDEINVSHGGENTKLYSTTNSAFKTKCLQCNRIAPCRPGSRPARRQHFPVHQGIQRAYQGSGWLQDPGRYHGLR